MVEIGEEIIDGEDRKLGESASAKQNPRKCNSSQSRFIAAGGFTQGCKQDENMFGHMLGEHDNCNHIHLKWVSFRSH